MKDTIILKMIWHKKLLYFNPLKGKNFPAVKGDEIMLPRAYGIALLHREPKKWACDEDVKEELKQHAIAEKRRKDILAGKTVEPVKKETKKAPQTSRKGGEK